MPLLSQIYDFANYHLGLDTQTLSLYHMSLRGILVFFFGLFAIKINMRFLALRTQFNFILYIMLGSILATGITGNAPFFQVLGMTLILLFLNWLLIKLTFHFPIFEAFFKGKSLLLIKNGNLQWKTLQRASISEKDLLCLLRESQGTNDLTLVKEAYLENNGQISFIIKS